MKTTPSPHPDWALAHKTKGTELRHIKGKYYLYEYKTVYDKHNKRPRKISGKLIGSITEKDGLVPSAKRILEKVPTTKTPSVSWCKEYGVLQLILSNFDLFTSNLKKVFPEQWKEILAVTYCRFVYRCPLKNIPFRLAASYLPEELGLPAFNEKKASAVLNNIGGQREKMLQYMRSFIKEGEYMLMDATDIFCSSKNIKLAKVGYSKDMQFEPLFNLMYIFSSDCQMPVYYRLLPGNIRDVKALKNSLLESGIKKAVIVADKGFYSETNTEMLQKENLSFVMPIKRDNKMIDYHTLDNNTFKKDSSFFEHEKRTIWHRFFDLGNGLTLYLFLDEQLRVKEDADYLMRIKTVPEKYNIDKYHDKKNKFGTIAMLSNINDTPQTIYQTYKSRMDIEVLFDSMKNIMEADHTYMQNEQTLEGWMFVNHIVLQWYQSIYIKLKEKNLLKAISVNDVIQLLTDVKKIKIDNNWYLNEFTSHTQKLMSKLDMPKLTNT
jgi:hypothetical protein